MALQPITSKKLKHPLCRCISSFKALEQKDTQPSQCIGWTLRDIYAICVDGLNGIDNRITTIHDSGDDFIDNLHQLAMDAPEEFCKIVLWLGKHMFDSDRNIAYNAQLMLEIIVDDNVMTKLKEQWYRYFDFEEKRFQRFQANYPLTLDGMNQFIKEADTDIEFKDWFPLDTFLPDSIKKEKDELKNKTFNPEDLTGGLPF